MKKTIKLAVVAALALGATSALATNGSNLIGTGAKARSMGGVSTATFHGAESGLSNSALITNIKGSEVSFGGTIFMPDVKNDMGGAGSKSSAANLSVIPSVSIATKVNDNFYMGLGMWGTAGMGVDYRTHQTNMKMVTNLQLMQFGVPMAYKAGAFSVGITPVLQYGSLDMNFDTNGSNNVGAGVSQDLKFGYNLGATYSMKNLTLGLAYKSQIDMEYDTALSSSLAQFGAVGYTNNKLSTPAELSVGVSYVMGASTFAFDYKNVQWSDAKGYQDFEWKNQDVYAIGYEYKTKTYSLRVGYNHSESPISEQDGTTGSNASGIPYYSINALNLVGFPAIVEDHYTIGGTYILSESTSIDLAYTMSPEVTNNYTAHNGTAEYQIETKHSQSSFSFGVNYLF